MVRQLFFHILREREIQCAVMTPPVEHSKKSVREEGRNVGTKYSFDISLAEFSLLKSHPLFWLLVGPVGFEFLYRQRLAEGGRSGSRERSLLGCISKGLHEGEG